MRRQKDAAEDDTSMLALITRQTELAKEIAEASERDRALINSAFEMCRQSLEERAWPGSANFAAELMRRIGESHGMYR